ASAWSATWSFRTLLAPPALTLPAENATGVALRPQLTWTNPNTIGVTGYTVQISKSSSFSPVLMTGNVTTTSFAPATNLPSGTTLYWRVQTTGSNGPSPWSSASFTTQ
ncbi:MAG TPA: fibronectin type III domain-containing protein, partial [Anaerolineales bacterium]|nr:fibronectin type III domain-containing protein [Anaerolineales bacterium]